jgi:hypothetical protein
MTRHTPEHCFNYHLKTNERYIAEMERSRAVRPDDDALVRSTFKEQYHQPVHDWLLIQSDKKRSKLRAFLEGGLSARRPPLSSRRPERRRDLIAESRHCRIDFNRAIFGPTPWQPDPRSLAPTAISREEIFGHAEPWTPREHSGIHHYSECMVKQLFQPAAAARLFGAAEENYGLLNELVLWTEKKTNGYPTDAFRGFDTLRPKPERTVVKAKMEEDHSFPPGYRKPQKTLVARNLTPRSLGEELKRATNSSYREAFCDDTHEDFLRTGNPVPPPLLKPIQNALPFGVFPEVAMSPRRNRKDYERASAEARNDRLVNKSVFEGPTCL